MTLNTFKPIRRLVAANNEQGQSYVLFDGPAPKAHQRETGPVRGHTDLWVVAQTLVIYRMIFQAQQMAVTCVQCSLDLSLALMIQQAIQRLFQSTLLR